MKITAAQHIYGNVEEKLSPNKVGGFQALFRTRSLITEEESGEIEERLVYFLSGTNPVKWLFFSISSKKAVISRIVPLQDVDKFGRSGSYLAHSLLLTFEDFIRVRCNPFIILDQMKDRFVGSVAEALKKGDAGSADIGDISLEIRESDMAAAEKRAVREMAAWQKSDLINLAHYAVSHRNLKEKRSPLIFIGDEEQIKNALQAALMFVPAESRTHCSFDTHFHDCNITVNYFWGIGYPGPAGVAPHLTRVDTVARKMTADRSFAVSLYEEWLRDCISQNHFADIIGWCSIAFELQQLISDQPCDEGIIRGALAGQTGSGSTDSSPAEFFSQIAGIYRVRIDEKIKRQLAAAVGEHLTPLLEDKILPEAHAQPRRLFYTLLDGFDLQEQVDELYTIYRKNIDTKPGREEIEELRALLEKTDHEYLGFFLLLWQKDFPAISQGLDRLSGEECREMLGIIFQDPSLPLHKIIPAAKIDIFADLFIAYSKSDPGIREYFPGIVEQLIENKQEGQLTLFRPLLRQLTLKQLKRVDKIVSKHLEYVPMDFRSTLDREYRMAKEAAKARKKKVSFKALINSIFGPRQGHRR